MSGMESARRKDWNGDMDPDVSKVRTHPYLYRTPVQRTSQTYPHFASI